MKPRCLELVLQRVSTVALAASPDDKGHTKIACPQSASCSLDDFPCPQRITRSDLLVARGCGPPLSSWWSLAAMQPLWPTATPTCPTGRGRGEVEVLTFGVLLPRCVTKQSFLQVSRFVVFAVCGFSRFSWLSWLSRFSRFSRFSWLSRFRVFGCKIGLVHVTKKYINRTVLLFPV